MIKTTLLMLLICLSGGHTQKIKTEHVDLVVKENVYIGDKFQYSIYLYYRVIKTDHAERNFVVDPYGPDDMIYDLLDGTIRPVEVKRERRARQIYAIVDISAVENVQLMSVKPYRFLATKWGKKRYIIANSFEERRVQGTGSETIFNYQFPHLDLERIW